mgnify:FL=1|tara:strand:- start:1246 stop:2766 length:1521 start_codon:yes stop_codon:yes gene_type:complete
MITDDDVKYVIVQAGGKGTRMGQYAQNRPKCLVPINDVPMIINTLNVYKDKEVIIIADHLSGMLKEYLRLFCKHTNYRIVITSEQGTAGGLKQAITYIPANEPFILTWADLFFEITQRFFFRNELLIGLSNTFKCRWSLKDKKFVNESSTDEGVAGFFVFKDKSKFKNLTLEKSLVRGFLTDNYTQKDIDSFYLTGCFEVGEKERYEEILDKKITHRFFNEVKIDGDRVYKRCIDPKYDDVHKNEKSWYKAIGGRLKNIPTIHSINPLVMDKIDGKHAWDIDQNKSTIINNYCDTLDALHSLGTSKGSIGECMSVYFTKAWKRVGEVATLLKHFNQPVITINGVSCQNPIYNLSVFEDSMSGIVNDNDYNIIHGDPSFSNSLVDKDNQIWLIDPRGSFGNTKIYGDRRYDWAKFYYSAVGNYDSMNSKKFKVTIKDIPVVELEIASNGYEEYGDIILQRSGMSKKEMDLIHANLWLSLTGYVKEDVEAALFSFYMGTYIWSTRAIT